MRKIGTIITALCPAAGILIAVLRLIHSKLNTAGELPSHGFLSAFLSAAAIIAIVTCFVAAYIISKRKMAEEEIIKCLPMNKGGIYLITQVVAALLILIHGIITYPTFPEIFKNHNKIAVPLAILFAAAHIFTAVNIYKRKNTKLIGYFGLLPPLYLSLQLGEIFYANMANPILLEYSYECLSLGACALFMLSLSGCALKKEQVFNVIFTGTLALICAPAAIAGPQLTGKRVLLYITVLIIVIPHLHAFTMNLIKRVKKEKSEAKPAEESETQEEHE